MSTLLNWVATHRKAIVAYASAIITILAVALPHTSPWYAVVIAIAGAIGVHTVPNAVQPATPAAPTATPYATGGVLHPAAPDIPEDHSTA